MWFLARGLRVLLLPTVIGLIIGVACIAAGTVIIVAGYCHPNIGYTLIVVGTCFVLFAPVYAVVLCCASPYRLKFPAPITPGDEPYVATTGP